MIRSLVRPTQVEHPSVGDTRGGVRCPQCRWRPAKGDRWYCECGHAWNTFETAGRCPSCQKQWTQTECLRCGAWSPHEAWYERAPSRS